ncbi:hypothetical protein [Nostoc sp. PCC 7107]|uniref:hypothetical protein n=1 Tax=Nostoc sp. PCC 7107 TaxID=317936 RepID=UPI00029ECC6F|nr:hypothetical protein [Nostoc sp. PCC 7107]AFY44395.1 PEP motif putative anchor domain protein [Nostoc sp. PCC 7107]
MMNNAFKKVVGAATLITLAVTMMPDAAQAQRFRYSGRSINGQVIDFDINTTVTEQSPGLGNDNLGYFPGAIQDFNIALPSSDISNLAICGQDTCPLGDLTISRLTTEADGTTVSNLNIDGGSTVTLNSLQNFFFDGGINFLGNVLRYDLSFLGGATSNQPDVVWFIQSDDSRLINNLTGLGEVNRIIGFFPSQASSGGTFSFDLQNSSQPVPEPSTVAASLLSVGALGMRSLLQHRKRLKKVS